MTGARRGDPGAALAAAVMQLPGPAEADVVAALAAVHDPGRTGERLTFHGAWGHAHRAASALGLPLPAWLDEAGTGRRAWALDRHLRTIHDLDQLGRVLDGVGSPWLCFKGPVLSSLYPHPDLRPYTDLDVLVTPAGLPAAVAALLDAGWPFIEAPADLDRRPLVGELHLRGPAGTPVDLHWHPFYRPDHPSRGRLDPAALVAAREPVVVGGRPVPTFPLAVHLVYVCAHAAAGGGNRLRWLTDVGHLASRASASDWASVVSLARGWGVRRSVSIMLDRACRHVGAAVPPWVPRTLGAGAVRSVAGLVEAVDPLPSSREHGSATAMLARAGERPGGAVARALLSTGRGRARRPPAGWPRRDVSVRDVDRQALVRFVDAVAELGR